MNYKQAADILDPATSREALLPYAYDPQYQQMLLRDACQLAAQVLRDRDEEIQKNSENVTDFGVRYRMVIERLKTLYLRSADEKGKILGMERYVFANYMFDTMRVIEGLLLQNVPDTNVGDKWVSVKDRMPEKSGEYLVSSAELGAQFVDTSFYFAGRKEWALFGEYLTHWMPMPELPKGEV